MAKKRDDSACEVSELDVEQLVRMGEDMTEQEMFFMQTYFQLLDAGHYAPLQESLRKAKYEIRTDPMKLVVGNRILAKWQSKNDHKEIMRLAGLGPLQVTMQMKALIEGGKSETARVQTLNIATKCLDMQKATVDAGLGVDLVIKRTRGDGLEEPEFERDMESREKRKEKPAPRGKVVRLVGKGDASGASG